MTKGKSPESIDKILASLTAAEVLEVKEHFKSTWFTWLERYNYGPILERETGHHKEVFLIPVNDLQEAKRNAD